MIPGSRAVQSQKGIASDFGMPSVSRRIVKFL